MFDYKSLVDKVLESNDYVSVIKESTNYNVKTFSDFVKIMQDFDEIVKKKGIKTKLDFSENDAGGELTWYVNQGYMNDKDRTLHVTSFDNGKVECDKSVRFRAPGSVNLNSLVDVNQILKLIDGYLYDLEREDKKNNNKSDKDDQNNKDSDKIEDQNKENSNQKNDDNFQLDPAIVKKLDDLKSEGESLINKIKAVPGLKYNDKTYKIADAKLAASTEAELVMLLNFPKDIESEVYSTEKSGRELRREISKYYQKNGFKGDKAPSFRYDMKRDPYFYVSVGRLPVVKTSGPEAKAILNYYDGNKIRFQPKESE